jgi:hypothetical protein
MNILKSTKFVITTVYYSFRYHRILVKIRAKREENGADHSITSNITGKEYLLESHSLKVIQQRQYFYPVLYVVDGRT